jgi:hypothetical protein
MSEVDMNNTRADYQEQGPAQAMPGPIVIKYKKPKKKPAERANDGKAKYSPGLKDIQVFEGDFMKIAQKATRALAKGVDTYEQERQKSAKKKTDGAIDDFFYNSAKASSAYIKEVSDIPVDLLEAVNRTPIRKKLRKRMRRASKEIRLWRL